MCVQVNLVIVAASFSITTLILESRVALRNCFKIFILRVNKIHQSVMNNQIKYEINIPFAKIYDNIATILLNNI